MLKTKRLYVLFRFFLLTNCRYYFSVSAFPKISDMIRKITINSQNIAKRICLNTLKVHIQANFFAVLVLIERHRKKGLGGVFGETLGDWAIFLSTFTRKYKFQRKAGF